MSNSTPPYSYHTFLFPFKWELNQQKDKKFSERTKVEKFSELIRKCPKWKRDVYTINNAEEYNEYMYFYDFVRNILYDQSDYLLGLSNDKNENLFQHFEYELPCCWDTFYEITLYKPDSVNKIYNLKIKSIVLNIYDTGVGVLSFHLLNNTYPKSESILIINQFGRRIFPPFLDKKSGLEGVKKKELAYSIRLKGLHNNDIVEGWHCYDTLFTNEKVNPVKLPYFITDLFSNITICTGVNELCINDVYMYPILDDRMFVISWYGDDKIGDEIKEKDIEYQRFSINNKEGLIENKEHNYFKNKFLYKFIYIDAFSKNCQNDEYQKKIIEDSILTRWSDYNTLYGVSRYSFVCLTKSYSHLCLPYINASFIPEHVVSMYYKMVELVLVQRASILRFSDEVADISSKDESRILDLVKDLYQSYIQFVNKIYFREVTAQEQGIELYDLLQKQMRIERDVKDLDREIQELHQFVALIEQEKQVEKANDLTRIATIFLIPTLIASACALIVSSPFVCGGTPDFYVLCLLGSVILSVLICIWKVDVIIRILSKKKKTL